MFTTEIACESRNDFITGSFEENLSCQFLRIQIRWGPELFGQVESGRYRNLFGLF